MEKSKVGDIIKNGKNGLIRSLNKADDKNMGMFCIALIVFSCSFVLDSVTLKDVAILSIGVIGGSMTGKV